jgi:hypothetical protein
MSASIETTITDSDEDLFVPTQDFSSDDDKNIQSTSNTPMTSSPNCSEEASSKENDKHSEDEKDGIVIPEEISESDELNQANTIIVKKSKRKKTKRGNKARKISPKINGRRSPKEKRDTDLDLLDALIAQNANVKVQPTQTETNSEQPKAAPIRKKKLAEIVREKREAAKAGLERKIDHAMKLVSTEPDKIKRFHEARSHTNQKERQSTNKYTERPDGSKTTEVRITREALESFRNHLAASVSNTGNSDNNSGGSTSEKLLMKYQELVHNGQMTIEEAIERAFLGKDVGEELDSSSLKNPLSVDPIDELLERERLFDNNYPADQARGPEFIALKQESARNATIDMVDVALETKPHLIIMNNYRNYELSLLDHEANLVAWSGLCKVAYSRFGGSRKMMNKGVPLTNPIKYYEAVLKQYMAQSIAKTISDMDRSGVFVKYDPTVRPLAVTCFQQNFVDLFPHAEIVADMSNLIDNGFVPKDVSKLNIFNGELVCYALFWSLSFNFNLFGAFFRGTGGVYNYHWIVYDRINQDIDGIIGPVDAIVMETVVPPHKNTSSTLTPDQPTDKNLTVSMKYKGISSLEADLKTVAEKFGTDDIADVCIKSKPGEPQRISIKFKDNATEEEKGTLLQYLTDMTKQNMS